MVRLRIALGVLSAFALANVEVTETSEIAEALAADDECHTQGGSGVCALELAQIRARKKHQHLQARDTPAATPSAETPPAETPKQQDYGHPDWMSSCSSIFMDLGSNIGVNVRKFFEPEKYPGAKLLPIFEKKFGSADARRSPKSNLCAIGFEPNPQHFQHLEALEKAYVEKGYKVHFYPFAAWRDDGFMALNVTGKRQADPEDSNSEGAHLSMRSSRWPGSRDIMVRTVDLASFIGSLPTSSVDLMLMDIEGSEYETLAQLMQKNTLCKKTVKTALIEAHEWGEITHWGDASSFLAGVHPRSFKAVGQRVRQLVDFKWCEADDVTEINALDDESYSDDVDTDFGVPQQTALALMEVDEAPASANLLEKPKEAVHQDFGYGHPDWLASCKSVFLDLGSNIGVNIRKFFEGEKYPGAKLLPVLDRNFGSADERRKSDVCALGFEPNPAHMDHLQKLEQAYTEKGFKVHFYPFASWRDEGFMAFNRTSKRGENPNDQTIEGAHLAMRSSTWPGSKDIMVRTVDLAGFIQSLPAGSVKLMLMDIEGSEYETLAQLMQKNVLCQNVVATAFVEAHGWGEITHWGDASSFLSGIHPRSFRAIKQRVQQLTDFKWCDPQQVTNIEELDDETYSNDVDEAFGSLSGSHSQI